MHNFEHKNLVDEITRLDVIPTTDKDYTRWVTAEHHLEFLRRNAGADEIVIYAGGEYSFVHSLVVPTAKLSSPDIQDLLRWSCDPFQSIASYVSGGGRDGVWLERGLSSVGSDTLEGAIPFVLGRTFEGFLASITTRSIKSTHTSAVFTGVLKRGRTASSIGTATSNLWFPSPHATTKAA